jgi:hypothetical protein
MPTDKFATCRFCTDRAVGCRTDCAGWAYREERKAERYAKKEEKLKAMYSSPNAERQERRNLYATKAGSGHGREKK